MVNRSILLIEDNKRDQELAQAAFRICNVPKEDVTIVRDGVEAISLLLDPANDNIPRVVILDLKMPKLDGKDVLKIIRQNDATQEIPVVILTSSNHDKDIEECYKLGANSYIRKPISFSDFTEIVQKVTEYWIDINITLKYKET